MSGAFPTSFGEYLDLYYNRGLIPAGSTPFVEKADDPYALARTDYFDPKYSMEIMAWGLRSDVLKALLPKTTYLQKGDSVQLVASDALSAVTAYTESSTPFSGDTDVPDVTDLDYIEPGYVGIEWKVSLQARLKSAYQKPEKMTPEKLKAYQTALFDQLVDVQLAQTVDTVTSGAPDSIDRIISCKAEDDLSWIDAGDCDLWTTQGTASIDRSAATTYDAQVDLPSSEANRQITLDMIDDIMATAKRYGSGNYIAYTNDDTINAIQRLIDPKGRYLHTEMNYEKTVNGVKTRKGVEAGRLTAGALVTNGLTIPVFSDPNVAVPVSGGAGNLYLIDVEHIELRYILPVTYIPTTMQDMALHGTMYERHWLITGMQLIADQFNCHAAVKYIAKASA